MKYAISPHLSRDWCHLCGKRSNANADIWYPNNAETGPAVGTGQEHNDRRYIRICADCGQGIVAAGNTAVRLSFGHAAPPAAEPRPKVDRNPATDAS